VGPGTLSTSMSLLCMHGKNEYATKLVNRLTDELPTTPATHESANGWPDSVGPDAYVHVYQVHVYDYKTFDAKSSTIYRLTG
jgi:hypothetical protein